MGSSMVQLIVLAAIAIFLVLRLRSVLGSREGFEKPPLPRDGTSAPAPRREFEVIEGGKDHDIAYHAPAGSPAADALARMKAAEPGFSVGEFLQGARGAYEMILMSFENGAIEDIEDFLDPAIRDAFAEVVALREREGLQVEAHFVGVREVKLVTATFDEQSAEAEMTIRFVGELTSVVRNAEGAIVEGNPNEIRRQKDVWTFARRMGVDDPNWVLVATGE
ncbi:MAG: Tim44 domain-containing protein [Rhodobacteraceae bacterium]|nr:Tim44 domain-containing protein [Paracoccaceae bacterium]